MHTPDNDPQRAEPLPLDEAARRILDEGTGLGRQLAALWQAHSELFRAELALSRSTLLRLGLYALVTLVLAGSAWLCLLAALIGGLLALGCPGWLAALLTALLLLSGTLICLLLARRLLPDLGFRHSRDALRQLVTKANTETEARQ